MEEVYPLETARRMRGECPFCGKRIHLESEFNDVKSEREYLISGLCAQCQIKVFKK